MLPSRLNLKSIVCRWIVFFARLWVREIIHSFWKISTAIRLLLKISFQIFTLWYIIRIVLLVIEMYQLLVCSLGGVGLDQLEEVRRRSNWKIYVTWWWIFISLMLLTNGCGMATVPTFFLSSLWGLWWLIWTFGF